MTRFWQQISRSTQFLNPPCPFRILHIFIKGFQALIVPRHKQINGIPDRRDDLDIRPST